ncbi:hypothetical protein N0V82_001080 [Gnomoniopsis sp. IMI 355080]|nr:hypothetical protein N0V82_001080 [Gnomoniopsis sp. IMI 355080]
MASMSLILASLALLLFLVKQFLLDPLFLSPLSRIPGSKPYAITKWRLAYEDWKGTSTRTICHLHQEYGPAVRIGPSTVSFNSLTALRTIYGPGSQYGRTSFYSMFDVYGKANLFTFYSTAEHGQRKKLLSHAYSKSVILKEPITTLVEEKAEKYLHLIESEPDQISEIFATLHYYSLDNITEFLYGRYGSTSAMEGKASHRALIGDILHPSRRRLSWLTVHFRGLTKWLYTRSGVLERVVKPLLPMQKPATYTGIREFALHAYNNFRSHAESEKVDVTKEPFILNRLWPQHHSLKAEGLHDLEIASECADHFLAGIDTTSDTLMFLVWAMSQPQNQIFQEKLREEVLSLPADALNEHGIPKAEAVDKLVYLNAVIKETLRLYAPLPVFAPRSLMVDSEIDGYQIPAGTVVGMAPYSLHRNAAVFKEPLTFNPDRWLSNDAAELNRWFWAFLSGGRMCIGIHLAMVEMTTLTAAIYRCYQTSPAPGYENTTPGITSRFEVFYDDQVPEMKEHCCLIKFTKVERSSSVKGT